MSRCAAVAALVLVLDATTFLTTVRADLHCAQPSFSAGTVHNGMPLAHRFTFVNRGDGIIEITGVRVTCDCLTPQPERTSLLPGEQGSLRLTINTLPLAEGPQSWRAHVVYREHDKANELELVITGVVATEILVQPSALTLPADLSDVHEITVTDRRASPLTIRAADSGTAFLRAVVGGRTRDAGTTVQKIRLEVAAACPEGRHELALHLYSDDPEYRELEVPITVVKRPRQHVSAAPRQVTLEGERGRPWQSRVVRLSAADGAEVEVERAEADDPAVHCTWTKDTVTVGVDPGRLTGDLQTAVRVHLRKPEAETVTVSVLCVVRQ
jgi:hypothetical protein